ncbi:hypothetical protein BDR22DRAFT_778699, partial [Usnea florida]
LLLQNMYFCCIAFIKFSILFFYRRIFPANKFRIATYALLGTIAAIWITSALLSVLPCTPVSYNWDRTQQGGHCIGNPSYFTVGISVPNIVTDILILLLPLPVTWKLQLRPKKKLALCGIFSLGIFATIASCIRLTFVKQRYLVFLWNNIEPDLAIICACLPTMMPLVRLVRESLASKITRLRTRPRTVTL